MTLENNHFFGEEQSITLKDRLLRYLAYWPLFLISTILCLGAGIMYIKYTVPKYVSNTSLLVKGSERGKQDSEDLIESALNGKREINLNNEMLLLSASRLMQRTVAKNDFNITYFKKGRLLSIDIYKDAPFKLIAKQPIVSDITCDIHLKNIDLKGGEYSDDANKSENLRNFVWNVPFTMNGQKFVLAPKRMMGLDEGEYVVRWEPVAEAASTLSRDLSIRPYDSRTSVILLALKIENPQKGKDVLNALLNEFSLSDMEDQNKLSENTINFINERLLAISTELEGVEGNLETYLGKNKLIDIKGQSEQSLENSNEISKSIKELAVQKEVASMLLNYFNQPPAEGNKLVPSSFGLNDHTLAGLITAYNELQLRKEREAPLVAPNSTVMQDFNTQISNIRGSILESLRNISKNIRLQEANFQQQNNLYKSFLSSLPRNERVLQEIKRKQTITESIYLYLLQKREESAISSTASNVSNYRQIDPATAYGPIEPNGKNIILYSVLLGLFLAFGFVYIRDLLNDKITSKQDIAKHTSLPILGQINHLSKRHKQMIAVLDRNIIGEQFRAIRTNLSFFLKNKDKKAILVTSTTSGEGKSFVSLNLAAVYAMPGKKVALLELDIRKPSILTSLLLEQTEGLTDFLSGRISNLSQICRKYNEIPNLHIYPSGSLQLNPADLLLTENMSRLFEELKDKYDYLIVDSPPAGLVSDPFIMGAYCDVVLYILRYQKTLKKQLDFIGEIVNNKTLSNVALIVNDMKKSNGSGYGYNYDSYYHYGNSNGEKKEKTLFNRSKIF